MNLETQYEMKRYEVPQEKDENTLALNRAILREGVEGVKCLYTGNVKEADAQILIGTKLIEKAKTFLNPFEHLGACEVYANKAINLLAYTLDHHPFDGVIVIHKAYITIREVQ